MIQKKRNAFSVLLESRKFHFLEAINITKTRIGDLDGEIFGNLTKVLLALLEDRDIGNFETLQRVFFGTVH